MSGELRINYSQYIMLLYARKHPDCSRTEMGSASDAHPKHRLDHVKRLERRGFVKDHAVPLKGRPSRMVVTFKGVRAMDHFDACNQRKKVGRFA